MNPEHNEGVAQLVNVIAARTEDQNNEIYAKVVNAYHTDAARKTIEEAYRNAFICAW